MRIILGIGEWGVSNKSNKILQTYALGSCVALTAYCPKRKTAGMVHVALPSKIKLSKGIEQGLGYYATSAVPLIIEEMRYKYACRPQDLIIRLFGGADALNPIDSFKIGPRNLVAIKNILTDLDLRFEAREVGGHYSRTVELEVATGRISVSRQQMII